MAKCPGGCGRDWLWDWCLDKYRLPNGIICNGETVENGEYAFACLCGYPLGACILEGPQEGHIVPAKGWEKVDWELTENSYGC